MFTKLSQLERKLSNLHLQDLQVLGVHSTDEEFCSVLNEFTEKYSQLFKVTETLGDLRDPLVLTLICKLHQIMNNQDRAGVFSNSKKEVLLLICETLRICFREDIGLSGVQVENLMMSLLSILKSRAELGFQVVISATRCLLNILNQHSDRMLTFVSPTIDGLVTLVDIILQSFPCPNLSNISDSKNSTEEHDCSHFSDNKSSGCKDFPDDDKGSFISNEPSEKKGSYGREKPFAQPANIAESKGAPGQDNFQDFNDNNIQEIQYCIKIIYMMVCQCEEIHQSLKNHRELLKSLIYRLARCIVYNHCPSKQCVGGNSSDIKLEDFPYSTNNAILCQDIYKLLYALDSYEQLEKFVQHRHYYQDEITIESDFIHFIIQQDSLLGWLWKVFAKPDANALLGEIDITSSSPCSSRKFLNGIDDIRISFSRATDENETSPEISRAEAKRKQAAIQSMIASPSIISSSKISLVMLFHITNMIILTISPFNGGWYYSPPAIVMAPANSSSTPRRANHHNNNNNNVPNNSYPVSSGMIYTGNLLICEEYCIQNLSLISLVSLQDLFAANSQKNGNSSNRQGLKQPMADYLQNFLSKSLQSSISEYLVIPTSNDDGNSLARIEADLQEKLQEELFSSMSLFCHCILVQRKYYFSNTILRLLVSALLKSKQLISNSVATVSEMNAERVVLLTPILMVCLKIMKADPTIKQYLQRIIFPNPYRPENGGVSDRRHNSKEKNMAPMDCPEGSIRFLLISYMISLDTNIKRCVNEVLFLLCNQDADEFIYRAGFGNAIAYLQTKGLV